MPTERAQKKDLSMSMFIYSGVILYTYASDANASDFGTGSDHKPLQAPSSNHPTAHCGSNLELGMIEIPHVRIYRKPAKRNNPGS